MYGGRAGAKSWGVGEAIVHYATNYPVRILCAREVQKSIRESSYRLLLDTIERLGLTDIFEWTNTEIRCLTTGALIVFEGLSSSNPEKIKSYEGFDIVWGEEAQTISQRNLDALIPTIRKPGSEIWFTYNPGLPTDPVSVMFQSGKLPPRTLIEKIGWEDNPKLSNELKDEIMFMQEKDPELFKHIYGGEFQQEGDNLFIPMRIVREAQTRKPTRSNVPRIGGLDVARFGKDSSSLKVRQGGIITASFQWDAKDLAPTPGSDIQGTQIHHDIIVVKMVEEDIDILVVDGGGLGSSFTDSLIRTLGRRRVVEFNGANSASDSKYKNTRAESWGLMKGWLETTGHIGSSQVLQNQLTTIKYGFETSTGKILLEKKEDMAKRGLPSPDEADALAMTFYKGKKTATNEVAKKLFGGPTPAWGG